MKNWKRYISCLLAAVLVSTTTSIPTAEIGMVPEQITKEAQAAANPKLNKTKLTLEEGKTYKLKLKNAKNVTWKSKNKKIAKISSKGNVRAVKEGTTKVYAVYKSKKYYCKVTVTKPEPAPTADTAEGRAELAKEAAKAIIKSEGIDKLKSDVAKVKAIHDYLVLNAVYDYDNYLNNTIPWESYEAYGVLVLKNGVCDSYTRAFQLFMELLEIPCERVTGKGNGGDHAWNVVTLDGERYHIDVTWDDPVPDEKGRIMYSYFLVDDAVMKKDHTWNSSVKPCTGTKYRMYPYEAAGQLAYTLDEVRELIEKQYSETNGEGPIQILTPKNLTSIEGIYQYLWAMGIDDFGYYPPNEIGDYTFYHFIYYDFSKDNS